MSPRYPQSGSQPKNSNAGASAPVKTIRIGRIKAAIWENSADQRTFYNVTFARAYLDEQKQWHDADSFGRDDLLLLSKLADQAHTYVCERMTPPKADGGESQ
jgi:hypothetical protein